MSDPGALTGASGRPLGHTVVRNTLYAALARFLGVAVNLTVIPVLVATLGGGFGAWVLALGVANHLGLFASALHTSLVQAVAKGSAPGGERAQRQAVGAYLALTLALGAVSVVVAALAAPWLAAMMGLKPGWGPDGGELLFVVAALAGGLRPALTLWEPVLQGLQRFGPASALSAARSALWLPLAAGAAWVWQQPLAVVLAELLVSLAVGLLGWIVLLRTWRRPVAWPDRAAVLDLVRYAGQLLASVGAGLLNRSSDVLIVGALLGSGVAAVLEVSQRASSQLSTLVRQLLSALLPAASELGSRDDEDALAQLLRTGQAAVSLVGALLFVPAFVFAPTCLAVWLGPSQVVPEMVLALRAFLLAYGLGLINAVGAELARGLARLEVEVRSSALFALTALPAKLALTLAFGLPGLLGAAILANAVAGTYALVALGRVLRYRWYRFLAETVLRPLLVTAGAGVGAWFALGGLPALSPPELLGERTGPALELLLAGALYALGFLGLAWGSGLLSADLRRLSGLLRDALRRRTTST